MKKIVASVAVSLALVCAAAPVFAQSATAPTPAAAPVDPAATAAAKELFESMNYRAVMIGAMHQMSQSMAASMRSGGEAAINNNPKLSADDKKKALAKLETDLPKATSAIQSVLNDPTLVDDILAETVPIYARNFSADELKQITAFYRTPVGAKMLASMPKLMGEGMQMGQQIMLRRLGPLMQKMQQDGKQE